MASNFDTKYNKIKHHDLHTGHLVIFEVISCKPEIKLPKS